jgi:hypothetical protein
MVGNILWFVGLYNKVIKKIIKKYRPKKEHLAQQRTK